MDKGIHIDLSDFENVWNRVENDYKKKYVDKKNYSPSELLNKLKGINTNENDILTSVCRFVIDKDLADELVIYLSNSQKKSSDFN